MIHHWSGGSADANMAEDILLDLAPLVHRHPWWRARTRLVIALLEGLGVAPSVRVLDAGCGWGTTLEGLEREGYRAVGADISRRALLSLDRPGRELAEFDLTRPLPGEIEPFDAVLALDVIEHLDDDGAALARLGGLLVPDGVLVASVPALPYLWTEFDAIQGHRRRYTPDRLRQAFEGSGLVVERVFWWGSWMVPILERSRRTPRGRPGDTAAEVYRRYLALPPWPGPLLMRAAYALEQRRAIAGKLATGTSLFAVARRP